MSIHDSKTASPFSPLTIRSVAGDAPAREVSLSLSPEFRARFNVGHLLGEGGMGAVYHAVRTDTGEAVALKFLILGGDADSLLRFMQEGDLLGRIEHPHVLTIHEMGMEGSCPYLVCEYLPGGTLSARMRAGALPVAETVRIAAELYEGLAAIHAAGIVHRDIKPANVMFDGAGLTKVTDLGVARLAEASEKLTRTGAFVGTPTYFSPEQSAGQSATALSDVYSAALLVHEMLAGRPPFVAGDLRSLLKMQLDDLPPALADLVPGVPPALSELVLTALEKHPADRPASAAEMATHLREILATLPRSSKSRSVQRPSTGTLVLAESDRPTPPTRARSRATARQSGLTAATPVPPSRARPAMRSSRGALVAALALALLAFAGWRALRPSHPPAADSSSVAVTSPFRVSKYADTFAARAGGPDALPAPWIPLLKRDGVPVSATVSAIPGFRARAAARSLGRPEVAQVTQLTGITFGTSVGVMSHYIELDDFLEGRGPRPRRLESDDGNPLNTLDETLWMRALERSPHDGLLSMLVHVHRGLASNASDPRCWYAFGALMLSEDRALAAGRAFSTARGIRFVCGRVRWPRIVGEGLVASLEDAGELESRWTSLLGCEHAAPAMLAGAAALHADAHPALVERLASAALTVPAAAPAAQSLLAGLQLARGEPARAREILTERTLESNWSDGSLARLARFEFERGRFPEGDRIQGGIGAAAKPVDALGAWAYRLCWTDSITQVPEEIGTAAMSGFQPTMEVARYDESPLRCMQVTRFLEAGDLASAGKLLKAAEAQPPTCWPWERLTLAALVKGAKDPALHQRALAALSAPMRPERVMLVSELAGQATLQPDTVQPYVEAFEAAHAATPWRPLLTALVASRRGLHRAAIDLAKNAYAADAAHELPAELALEIAFRPIFAGLASNTVVEPDRALVDAALANLPVGDTPHRARVRGFVTAVLARDFDAVRRIGLELFEDDPVCPAWTHDALGSTRLPDAPEQVRARARQLAATARYWSCGLWILPTYEKRRAEGVLTSKP